MNTNDKQLFWLKLIASLMVCIIVLAVLIMVNVFVLDQGGGSDPLVPTTEDSVNETRLISAIQELSSRIESLQSGSSGNFKFEQSDSENAKVKIEPSVSNLEVLIEKLIKKLGRSVMTSERMTVLRDSPDKLTNWGAIRISSKWNNHTEALRALFMMTYSQVIEKVGWPHSILTHGNNCTQWNYKDGGIMFIDGYLSNIWSNDWN